MPPTKPPGSGTIAYGMAYSDTYDTDGSAWLEITGCIMSPDSTVGSPPARFSVTVPLSYGDGQAELHDKVLTALADEGITGLADAKFVPF